MDFGELVGAILGIVALLSFTVLYVSLLMGRISLGEFLTELVKSQIPIWVWIAIAFPILGAVIVIGLAFLRSD